jgi:hypothetical protein
VTRQPEHWFRALTLLVMGCTAIAAVVIAADPFGHYSELPQGARIYYTISLAGGVALLLCLLAALGFPSRLQKIAGAGTFTALALAINQAVGLHLGTILCHTPS